MSTLAGAMLGLAVGLRHAFEPDHLTAVATLATETRELRRGAVLGALWGLGHTCALLVVAVILLSVGAMISDQLAAVFELAVCAMLIVLGARAIVRGWRQAQQGPVREHRHHGRAHRHVGPEAHLHIGTWMLAWRPLAVGLVHGLAGSGALTALVFAQLSSAGARLGYIALFGIGSVAGMVVASALVGASLSSLSRAQRALMLGTGACSIVLGIVWSLPLWSHVALAAC